jgi:opacity protein-like surface antigen
MLNRTLALIGLLVMCSICSYAQSATPRYLLSGFIGPGVKTAPHASTLQFGIGGEMLLNENWRMGGEIGYNGRTENVFNSGLGLLSLNVSYGVPVSDRWTPFVTGGYTILTAILGSARGMKIGGGTDVRIWKRMSLRFEVRDQIGFGNHTSEHFYGARVGPVFSF